MRSMNSLYRQLETILSSTEIKVFNRSGFLRRLKQGNLTRDEDKDTHFCVYFAAFDPKTKYVFIGRHKKSGLWLFNGGHIEKRENLEEVLMREMREEWGLVLPVNTKNPNLATITKIKKPSKTPCFSHYDIWYFVPVSKNKFKPDYKKLKKEFFENRWLTVEEAKKLVIDKNTLIALKLLK